MRTRSRFGVVYLLHFDRPYHHARRYVGVTADVEARPATHRAGKGARLTRAVRKAGIDFVVLGMTRG